MTSRMSRLASHCSAALIACAMITGASVREGVGAEISRTPFTKHGGGCSPSNSCTLSFGTVPGGGKRRYEITHVSCEVFINNVAAKVSIWHLGAQRDGVGVGAIFLRPHHTGIVTLPPATVYHANEQGLLVVYGGTHLFVRITRDASTTGNITGLNCSISGYDVRLD